MAHALLGHMPRFLGPKSILRVDQHLPVQFTFIFTVQVYIYIYIYKYTSEKEPAALAAQCVELSPTQVVSLDPEVAGS